MDHLLSHNLLSPHQHAFISKHSTTTNLLECIHDWTLSLQSRHSTDIIYIDFSRAFDSIVFSKLLFVLQQYGITGRLLNWIENFISYRSQCVVVKGSFSSVCEVVSGVPQGSVLGPILFLIYINDIEKVCMGSCLLKLFADDLKLYCKITVDCPSLSLQSTLNNTCEFANDRQLAINFVKCNVLSVSRTSSSTPNNSVYLINNIPIKCVPEVTDLGVTISSDLSFKAHINSIVAKARQRQGIFFRGFCSRDLELVRKAFITYIRPILEFNSIIWNPTEIYLIDLIEKVQRNFTKNIPYLNDLSYNDRLAKLKLEPLELRRLHFDLVFYYKIINHLLPIDPYNYFTIYLSPLSSRSDPTSLHRPVKATERTLASFFYRQTPVWNGLPSHVKSLQSVASFKHAIKSLNFKQF